MKTLEEFKAFALRGNVIDMAIGIIIGAAFTSIVRSIVDDIFMPVLGLLTQGIDYTNLFVVLKQGSPKGPYFTLESAQEAGAITLNFGSFLSASTTFLVTSLSLFVALKGVTKLYKKEESKSSPPRQETLLEEIRDELRSLSKDK